MEMDSLKKVGAFSNQIKSHGVYDLMSKKLTHCFTKFPGIPAENFGDPHQSM